MEKRYMNKEVLSTASARFVYVMPELYRWIGDSWPHMDYVEIPHTDDGNYTESVYMDVAYCNDLLSLYGSVIGHRLREFKEIMCDLHEQKVQYVFFITVGEADDPVG